MSDQIRIAVPRPDADGAHAIVTPVEAVVEEGAVPDGRAMVVLEGEGAVLTPEQCFSLSDHFNRAGEVLRRYHDEVSEA